MTGMSSLRHKVALPCAAFLVAFPLGGISAAPHQHAAGNAEIKTFARELQAALKAAGASRLDTNQVMISLIAAGFATKTAAETNVVRYLSETPSLGRASEIRQSLRRLSSKLAKTYGFKISRRSTGDIIMPSDQPRDPRLGSWRLLNSLVEGSLYLQAGPDIGPPKRAPLRWRIPVRIASTGVQTYDDQIKRTLSDLKNRIPSLPIDKNSFPAPIAQANLFIDIDDIVCRAEEACKVTDTWPAFDELQRRKPVISSRLPMMRALVFFGRLDGQTISKGNAIYPINANTGDAEISAWLRADLKGGIQTAGCTGVAWPWWPKAGNALAKREPVGEEAIAQRIRACIGAALGAPARFRDWSLSEAPPAACGMEVCLSGYDQNKLLEDLYR
jgi:hypothetical protein